LIGHLQFGFEVDMVIPESRDWYMYSVVFQHGKAVRVQTGLPALRIGYALGS